MFGEIKAFKRSMFGGFNRRDVVGYIGALAEERNKCRAAQELAESEAQRLSEEALNLRERLEESERNTRIARAEALDEVSKTFSLLENACDCVRASIEATSCHIRSELDKVGDSIAVMSSAVKKTGERMSELLSDGVQPEQYEPESCGDMESEEE